MNDPFPHGTPRGVQRGCRDSALCPATPTCRQAAARAAKTYRIAAAQGRPGTVEATAVLTHVHQLRARHPHITERSILLAAGATHDCLQRARKNNSRITRRVSDAILAVTADQVLARQPYVRAGEAHLLVGQMRALGYPITWQAARVGCTANQLGPRSADARISRDIYQALLDLRDQINGAAASTGRDGIRLSSRTRTIADATAEGFYPPAAYDDDGALNLRFLPGHPWAQVDEVCADRLDLLRLIAAGHGSEQVAEVVGNITSRTIQRLRASLGVLHADGQREQVLARITATIDGYDRGDIDPVDAVLDLGAIDLDRLTRQAPDHPVLTARTRVRVNALAA